MEYHESNPQNVRSVGIKSLTAEMFTTNSVSAAEAVEAAKKANKIAQVNKTPVKPTRKIIDDEDVDGGV